jgi:hypothetical protein
MDGNYVVAQYGQWDGYPEGQGKTVYEFLKRNDLEEFRKQLAKCYFASETELEEIQVYMDNLLKNVSSFEDRKELIQHSRYNHLHRDTGADILNKIHYSLEEKIVLENSISFAGDSLFCEWAYVIDLDKNTLEVYKGLNKHPIDPAERFANLPIDPRADKYYQIKLLKSFPLNDLPPTAENFFLELAT